ncbi:MAG: aminotransferase class I/II-fold pyridoxal phosphate-dependent enzyme [Elusimicrobia bacterium]|nr:aminotransferase class I/II-fold pyridoxal phosphate-dependent enzyme [Candidatus Obscuribacterium magneticum]
MSSPTITIHDLTINEKSSIRSVLELINRTALGISFIVDGNGKLTGTVTDGDVRRALIKGITLETSLNEIMQRNYVALAVTTPHEIVLQHLSERIAIIPLLDEDGRPIDFASHHRLHQIPIMEPLLDGNEVSYVMECLQTNWISSQGRFVNQFEKVFSEFHAGQKALAVSNGTVALHLALVTLGIGRGDEVIVPDLTFAASANAVIHAGATPVFVDVTEETWTLNPELVEKAITPKTKAIMPVHLYGQPCDMDPLMEIAKKHDLRIIEDCAEAFGATYKSRLVGTFAEAGCFSFFGNKLITTGEGGMILFNNEEHYNRARLLRDHGMTPQRRYWHLEAGYNYRLTNLQAAIGVAQMERANSFIVKKRSLASQYETILKNFPGITLPLTVTWAKSSYWLYTILVNTNSGFHRDELMHKLLQNGIETRPAFHPLHTMPPYTPYVKHDEFPITNRISQTGLSLPSAVSLRAEEIERISQAFQKIQQIKELTRVLTYD